jgi:UDP-3-O-[3-hydroxymyristoyl] glucosamine N-acyltransferase
MKFEKTYQLEELFREFDVTFKGDRDGVSGMNEIHRVVEGDLSFVDHPKYYQKALDSKASFVLIDQGVDVPENKTLIITKNPFTVFNSIASRYAASFITDGKESRQIDGSTIIEPGAQVHPTAVIGKECVIHSNAVIGPNVILQDRVIIHPNAAIGIDAFYYHKKEGKYTKWHTIGAVLIEDDVEIGAACTISRGVSSTTRIGKGTKLDAQVHIGHGVIIEENCLIAAQAGISGKTIIEAGTTIYGQAGIAQNLRIGPNSVIAAKAGVAQNLEGGKTYFGIPARDMKEFYREFVSLKNLPDLIKKWRKI